MNGNTRIRLISIIKPLLMLISISLSASIYAQKKSVNPSLEYTISMPDPANRLLNVALECKGLNMDTVYFKIPRWMPGYYQMLNYYTGIRNFSAQTLKGTAITFEKTDSSTWRIVAQGNSGLRINYDVYSDKRFVAQNYLDTTHAYIVTAATLMYPDGLMNMPVNVTVIPYGKWSNVTTGLEKQSGNGFRYTAQDFDILYDCPILTGNLEELPSFTVDGVIHRFIAYNPGQFDREAFISSLEKTIRAGIEIIGEIPYKEYTFIGIGSGAGGIEHLNNTTVPFNGARLGNPESLKGTLKFLAHEYFHNYNVKRIRPFELGPFDYSKEARTNLLWFSEGVTVYYEYLMLSRAGIINANELFSSLESNINAVENDPGRKYQSLVQASYQTWSDGPFGNSSSGSDRSISVYDKGAVVGFILDLKIRNATANKKSLDDVMRYLYATYYKKLQRGFTDAEFQEACENIAGVSLNTEFEYVYTTKDIDYTEYLTGAGLKISEVMDPANSKRKLTIALQDNPTVLQTATFRSWSGN